MQRVCPDCGSKEALRFIADVGQEVCSDCGAVLDDFQVYDPTSVHEVAYSLGGSAEHRLPSWSSPSLIGPSGRPLWSSSLEDSRKLNEYHRKPEVDARIQGTLSTLGHPGLFRSVEFLFQRAREASWKDVSTASTTTALALEDEMGQSSSALPPVLTPRRVKWGQASLLLATACCYAVLRREGIRVDIETVSNAAHLPALKVRRAFRLLKLLVSDAVRDIRLANPDSYIHRILTFFHFNLAAGRPSILLPSVIKFLGPLRTLRTRVEASVSAEPTRALVNTPFEAVEATALDLCNFWWPKRSRFSIEPQLAAFAIAIMAMQAHVKQPAPIHDIFLYTHHALCFGPNTEHRSQTIAVSPDQSLSDDVANKTAVALHSELSHALQLEASKIPWLADMVTLTGRGHSQKRAKKASPTSKSKTTNTSELVRRELLIHVLDILDVWKVVSAKGNSDTELTPAGPAALQATPIGVKAPGEDRSFTNGNPEPNSDQELDQGDLDCFLSSPRKLSGLGMTAEDLEASGSGESQEQEVLASVYTEFWPRVVTRLQEANVLQSTSANAHPIDLLSDDQVDRLLFDADELDSLFRTDPIELAAFERAKVAAGDWPAKSSHERDVEFRRLAHAVAQDIACSNRKADASGSDTSAEEQQRSSKRKGQHRDTVEALSDGSMSRSRTKKRLKPLSPVSLREQQDESDWSD